MRCVMNLECYYLTPLILGREQFVFYEKLYSCECVTESDTDNVFFFENLAQVSEDANTKLCEAMGLEELYKALQGMESGKAPGINGFPVDFYKSFWTVLGEDLLAVLNESLVEGRLPLSCRRAVLTLLPKKGDLTEIKNWCPVSLLCTDYKLLSKVLANRMAGVMEQVIHPDQSYCIPARSIFDNISLVRDILEVSKLFNLDCALFSLDQEKAFDRVEHNYLWKTLAAFGFCQDFVEMVKMLYTDVESVLKVNGGLCTPFKVGRGVRQGCSLSGMLYSLAIEPLLQQIRANLTGLNIPGYNCNIHLSAYADDVIVIVNSQKDIEMLKKLLDHFRVLSSAKINWNKSAALLCGKWTGAGLSIPDGLLWSKGGLKYLGVFLGDENTVQKNWEGIVEKIKGRLAKWKWLAPNMSYKGRTLVINNLIASSLWHKLKCIDPPVKMMNEIQALLVDFFWDKLHWITKSILFLSKEDGGQGLINLQSRTAASRLQFIQRLLLGSSDFGWRVAACAILRSLGGLQMDKPLFLLDPQKLDASKMPIFYRNLFKVWSLFNQQRTLCTKSLFWLLNEPIICGARLDISTVEHSFPGLKESLCKSKITTLSRLLNVVGPNFMNIEKTASHLGFFSTRIVTQMMDKACVLVVLVLDDKVDTPGVLS